MIIGLDSGIHNTDLEKSAKRDITQKLIKYGIIKIKKKRLIIQKIIIKLIKKKKYFGLKNIEKEDQK